MVKQKVKKRIKQIMFWTGSAIVVTTHIVILSAGLPQDQLGGHAFLNLVASGLIIGQKLWK